MSRTVSGVAMDTFGLGGLFDLCSECRTPEKRQWPFCLCTDPDFPFELRGETHCQSLE